MNRVRLSLVPGAAAHCPARLRTGSAANGDAPAAVKHRDFRADLRGFEHQQISARPSNKLSLKKGTMASGASAASIGNNRANAVSENEPNYESDCEGDCEVRHHIT
jgi:hypothetical protein